LRQRDSGSYKLTVFSLNMSG